MISNKETLKKEFRIELLNIVSYWKSNSLDEVNGGFIGARDHDNNIRINQDKGIILNTRLLWTFSFVENFDSSFSCKAEADRAYQYLKANFKDDRYGGVFWSLNFKGEVTNSRKQIYAQAFLIYALSEYYKLTGDQNVLNWALEVFDLIEDRAKDLNNGGYFEAFRNDWDTIEDMRLSEKDLNASKTMNTHLHLLEAYTSLYAVSGNFKVKNALDNLIHLHLEKFLNSSTKHFYLFFDDHWNNQTDIISYGHDIEAAWLLIEAAHIVEDKSLLQKVESLAIQISDIFLKEAYVKSFGIINEKKEGVVDEDRHWWPQVEAMLGLAFVSKIEAKQSYHDALIDIWDFVKTYIIDKRYGEWFFRINKEGKPYESENKIGMWKCPYHNSRALVKLIQML
ncbi:mannobiose 2-epimerase [Zunongwangia mangrovi]|uniref:Cellobiose 2-epimerase n=1 Tax=Zunongwangia mangrovi TaxID=1334022 RepID=A0A1I1EBS0_9FLAO|nr:AGE family epimerase/isomerase [Zunongwangia mangrovi]SFB84561.1 mannobiose 2-epimerase [Zunongwangia mangrovi]